MKTKIILGLALILSSGFAGFSQTSGTNTPAATRLARLDDVKIVSPEDLDLPGFGTAIFKEQVASFSLQVPIGDRRDGKPLNTNTPVVQVWLLKTDGASVPQLTKPSAVIIGSIGDYSTEYAFYEFPKIPVKQLAGFVVSINGKLYCRQLKTGKKP